MQRKRLLQVGFGTVVMLSWACSALAGLKYEGSVPMGEAIIQEASRAFEAKEKIKFDSISTKGTDEAFKAVMEDRAEIGGVARSLTAEDKKLKLYSVIIGYDALVVFVHESNSVKNLTKEQVKNIFTGDIKNWKEVGGKDAMIRIFVDGTPGRTVNKEFKKNAMGSREFAANITQTKAQGHISAVGSQPDAITFDTLAFGKSGIRAVSINGVEPTPPNVKSGTYVIGRPLQLVTKGLPKGEVKKFVDFMLSGEGQDIVSKNFISVK